MNTEERNVKKEQKAQKNKEVIKTNAPEPRMRVVKFSKKEKTNKKWLRLHLDSLERNE